MKVANFQDFRGGYCTNVPSPLMKPNELSVAQNCYWKDGLIKRQGISQYSSTAFSGTIVGGIRTRLNDVYTTIVAVDDTSDVTFYQGTGATFASFTATTFTTGKDNVDFGLLNGKVVACNGFDDPVIISVAASGTWSAQTIDAYDERALSDSDWWAGQYDVSEATAYVDDTTHAQDDTTNNYGLVTATTNDGHWISCDFKFNKVIYTQAAAFGGSPVASYQYWNASATWGTLTLVTTPNWTAATADKTMEFDMPTDWAVTSSVVQDDTKVANRYLVRVRFTTASDATYSCDKIALSNTQKFTEIVGDERPLYATAHGSRLWFSFKDSVFVNYSRPNVLTGWRDSEFEYFHEGGDETRGMASYKGHLLVFKDNATYAYFGDSFDNFNKRKVSDKGTVSRRSISVVGDYVFRACQDGIWMWDGTSDRKVSRHIQNDYDGWTTGDAAATEYDGWYWISFPTNNITLVCDPDTLRQDEKGDWRVSWYKFTNYKVNQFVKALDSGDLGFFLGLSNQTTPYIARLENTYSDATPTSTAITMTLETADLFDDGNVKKYSRFKPVLLDVSASGAVAHTFTLYSDFEALNTDVTATAQVGTDFVRTEYTLPYTMDGNNLRVKMVHSTANKAGLMGFSLDYATRRY